MGESNVADEVNQSAAEHLELVLDRFVESEQSKVVVEQWI